jgi:hypothetical protein
MSMTISTQNTINILDTEPKRRIREIINANLTESVRNECPGIAILVLTLDEYDTIMEALRERADRKRKVSQTFQFV